MDRFPVLRRKARQQASTLSGGEQKMLEIARGLMLEPKLMLIDEPSIGLSPILVEELFGLLRGLRARGITVLMIEQNAKRALENSDHGIVLELGRTRIAGPRGENPRRSAHRAAVSRRRAGAGAGVARSVDVRAANGET